MTTHERGPIVSADLSDPARFEGFLEGMPDTVVICDAEGRIIFVNLQAEQLAGYPRSELLGEHIEKLVPEALRHQHLGHRSNFSEQPTKRSMGSNLDIKLRRKDGTLVPVDIALSPVKSRDGLRIVAVVRDITERITIRKTLEARFQGLLEGMPDAVVVCDPDGRIDFVNLQTEHLTGYAKGELHGKRVETLIPNDLRRQHVGHREEYSGHPTLRSMGSQLDIKLRRKNGSDVTVDIALSPVDTDEGLRIVAVVRDITERLRIQAEAKSAADAEVARAKDELISLVSHEMRTPLASIVGFTDLLMTRDYSKSRREHYLDIMLQEGKRLAELVNDFLDLQRMEGGRYKLNLSSVELVALIKRAVANVQDDPKAPITLNLPNELPNVVADADAVLQVLTNLISNARKYSPEGGEIIVSALSEEDTVSVSVRDHGIGLSEDELSRLFQKFYRTETADTRRIKGTGLGLAISRRIVEAHGGRISVTSAGNGKGSEFTFTLHIAGQQRQTADVLLVEDNRGFAQLMQAELEAKGLTTIWAPEAETADRLMDQGAARAVVLDLLLPGIQGDEFLIGLRASHGGAVPVVVVTMKPLDPESKVALHEMGATAVLGKHRGGVKAAAALLADALKVPREPAQ